MCCRTAATGTGFALGLLLLCISQMHAGSRGWDTATFYMHHVWAGCVVALAVRQVLGIMAASVFLSLGDSVFPSRHTLFRLAAAAACFIQHEFIMGAAGDVAVAGTTSTKSLLSKQQ